ncbi:MAG TPA: hypothetical protein VFG15_06270 [Amycolatopsis sp.]|nr:hypothetical protein [Amycolatopsis sp.]
MNQPQNRPSALGGLITDIGAESPPHLAYYDPERDGALMSAEQSKKYRPLLGAIDTITPLADASGHDLIDWAMHARRACPQPKTIRCTVEQAETLAAMSGGLVTEVRFGMEASVLGLPIEWVTDPADSTFFAGRTLAAMDTGNFGSR